MIIPVFDPLAKEISLIFITKNWTVVHLLLSIETCTVVVSHLFGDKEHVLSWVAINKKVGMERKSFTRYVEVEKNWYQERLIPMGDLVLQVYFELKANMGLRAFSGDNKSM